VDPTAREIEQHIAEERGELDRDIHELQRRVKDTTNWRWQVRRKPLAAMGIALAGGFLAAKFIPRRRRAASYSPYYTQSQRGNRISRSRDVMLGWAMGMGMRGLAKILQA
jgi:hypothetical protein